MKRFVSYLYSTYNNQKIHNAGFARVELRTGRNRIDIHLRENGYAGKTGTVYLFIRKKENIQGISIGNIIFRGNQADFRYEQPDENIGQTPWQIEQMHGILIMIDDRGAFLSQWDEEPVDTTRFQIWNDPSAEKEQAEKEQAEREQTLKEQTTKEQTTKEQTEGEQTAKDQGEEPNSGSEVPDKQNTDGQSSGKQKTEEENSRKQNAAGQKQRPQNGQQAAVRRTAGQNQRSQNGQRAASRMVSGKNAKEQNLQRQNERGQRVTAQNEGRQNIQRQNTQTYNNKMSGRHDTRTNHSQKNEFTVINDNNLDHMPNDSADSAHTLHPTNAQQDRTNVNAANNNQQDRTNAKPVNNSQQNQHTVTDHRQKTQYIQMNGGQEWNNGQIGQERNNGQIGQERNNGQIGQERNNGQIGQEQYNVHVRQEQNSGQMKQEQNNRQIVQEQNNRQIVQGQNNVHIGQEQNDGVNAGSEKTSDLRTTELQPQQSANMQWDQTWRYMLRTYPSMNQFSEKNDVLCVRIEIKDVRLLPEKYWSMINNSFLLHGFFNYRHLAFGRIGQSWFVGIPGIYQNQEHVMASIFGFPDFLPHAEKNERGEQPGYWYRILDIE